MGGDKERPMGSKKAKELKKGKSDSIVATVESQKVASIQELASASRDMAAVLSRKEKNDTSLKMAQMYLSLGKADKAEQIMKEMQVDRKKQAEEDERKRQEEEQKRKATQTPVSENTMEATEPQAVEQQTKPSEFTAEEGLGRDELPRDFHALSDHDDSDSEEGSNAEFRNVPKTGCLLYTSPSPRDKRQSRMPSSA